MEGDCTTSALRVAAVHVRSVVSAIRSYCGLGDGFAFLLRFHFTRGWVDGVGMPMRREGRRYGSTHGAAETPFRPTSRSGALIDAGYGFNMAKRSRSARYRRQFLPLSPATKRRAAR